MATTEFTGFDYLTTDSAPFPGPTASELHSMQMRIDAGEALDVKSEMAQYHLSAELKLSYQAVLDSADAMKKQMRKHGLITDITTA